MVEKDPSSSIVNNPYESYDIYEEGKLKGVQRAAASRLSESWHNNVHVTVHRDIDVSFIDQISCKNKNASFIDYVLSSVTKTLCDHKDFNAIFIDGKKISYKSVHLGIAVDTPRGLIVPVLHDAEKLGVDQLKLARREIIDRAREWKHTTDELVGGTFTVSNLAGLEIDYFTPIINPPQVAILGIGRKRYQSISWSKNKNLTNRALLPVSLSFDHRVINGADAARFLLALQKNIQDI